MNKKLKYSKWIKPFILLVLIAAVFFLVRYYNLTRYLSLDYIQSQIDVWKFELETNKFVFVILYFLIYVIATSISLPGAALLTLLGGALFGIVEGTVIVSFASTIGATLAFLVSRFFLRESIENRFKEQFDKINKGVRKEGSLYLFALRLVPIFPFFVINLVMGLTKIKVLTYMLVSQVGMLAGTIVYVNAGRALANIRSTAGIFSTEIWGAFALLALLPFISKKIISFIQKAKIYKNFKKPTNFDTNMVVIGAGAGGLISAYIAATLKASVTLIEKAEMGGDCLNRGCVPSKALITASKYASLAEHSAAFGIKQRSPIISFSQVMNSVQNAIKNIAPHDSVERYEALGVRCIKGNAKIISPWEVEVNDTIIKTRAIVIATGGVPFIPKIEGLLEKDILTSDSVWNLKIAPKNLIVIGGGPIGCELAQALSRLGVNVTIVEMAPQILIREDKEVAELARAGLEKSGVKILVNHQVLESKVIGIKKLLILKTPDNKEVKLPYDKVLVAIGRKANTESMLGSDMGIALTDRGTIETNEYLQTNFPNIYAVGDVVGPYQFTHTASHMAWYAAVNALFGHIKMFAVDYRVIPAVTFLEQEIARVGLSEKEAIAQNIAHDVTFYRMEELDRAIAEQKTEGFIKVITAKDRDKILGATVASERAGEILAQFILAMKHNLGLNKILATMFPYPTYSEATKGLAGAWKKKRAPEKTLHILEKLFQISLRNKNN